MIRNLYWRKLFGRIPSTDKVEKEEINDIARMRKFEKTAHSPELDEFNRLFHTISAPSFVQKKKSIQLAKYKDSKEYEQLKRFRKLDSMSDIKAYFEILDSKELLNLLQFKQSREADDLNDKGKVAITAHLKEFKNFEQSKAYKNFLRFHNSYIIKEYLELKETVETEEFKKANEYWSNPNRWETTEEYAAEKRYQDLLKNPDINNFVKSLPKDSKQMKKWDLIFEDQFNWKNTEDSKWEAGFKYPGENMLKIHSFHNELQANTGGKNIETKNGSLSILTKKEPFETLAWHPQKGFISKKFDFTSDAIHTGDLALKFGKVRIKLKSVGQQQNAVWLKGKDKTPHINVFRFDGNNIKLENNYSSNSDTITIKGINPSEYYIYELQWTNKELIWSINNIPVFRSTKEVPQNDMFLTINSFLSQSQIGSEGSFDIDWVRIYQETTLIS